MLKRIVVAAVLAAAALPALADYRRGLEAYNNDDYETAFREFIHGALQGEAISMNNLGKMYAEGLGTPVDYEEAVKWYRRAAEFGEARAQYNLGLAYDRGVGVPLSPTDAVKWYQAGAELGDAFAQNSLGVKMARGEGTEQDVVHAYIWFSLSAARHPAGSDREAANANREQIAQSMTSNQLAEAERLLRFWQPKKAKTSEAAVSGATRFDFSAARADREETSAKAEDSENAQTQTGE
jgi:TPR repeat protein